MALAAPVKRDNFSFAGDSLFVEASGNNLHRRATIPELQAHFDAPQNAKDVPAHWYEAQLLHYGLPPSKSKGTAKMRLYDAVKTGSLNVPAHLLSMEADLRKLWKAQARGPAKPAEATPAKPAAKPRAKPSAAASKSSPAAPKKTAAKADGPLAPPSAKKRKAPVADVTPPAPKKPAKSTATAPKPPATKKAKPPAPTPTVPKDNQADQGGKKPRTKQTARRGGSFAGKAGSASRDSPPAAAALPPRQIQTARRGGWSGDGGRSAGHQTLSGNTWRRGSPWELHDDEPPSYAEAVGDWHHHDEDEDEEMDDQDQYSGALRPTGRRLGLLNGRYDISCSSDAHPGYGRTGTLVLTLDGQSLWGSIDIAGIHGIMRFSGRPYEAAEEHFSFNWRGHITDDWGRHELRNGNWLSPVKWLAFPGEGEIWGSFQYGRLMNEYFTFQGMRVSGQQTRSEISPSQMRAEWELLTEQLG